MTPELKLIRCPDCVAHEGDDALAIWDIATDCVRTGYRYGLIEGWLLGAIMTGLAVAGWVR